jgi:4'-phosphopantetheinyl transferase
MGLLKIVNRSGNSPQWMSAETCDFIPGRNADIWRLNINLNSPLLEDFKLILRQDEIDRTNRYLREKDRIRFIVSRGALRQILGMYLNMPPVAIEFAEGKNKKPYIVNPGDRGLHYNLSHSNNWIVIAIANSEIGIDTEFVNPDFDYREIITDVFGPGEVDFIKKGNSLKRFFTLWTRKEALIKATGQGMDENFKAIPSMDGDHVLRDNIVSTDSDWLITSLELDENYLASVATNSALREIRFWNADFRQDLL